MSEQILSVQHLSKRFGANEVLRDIDFSVQKGDVTSIIGASGSGKSTLLRCINLLETPTAGQILFHGEDITRRGYHVPAYRAKVGMVFQSFNLFNNMTVLDNCMVGLRKVMHQDRATAEETAKRYLEKVGMLPYINAKPRQISGGQKQRVAIARAMVNEPALILADEPTGALDSQTSRVVMDLFHELHEKYHKTIVLITHNPELAEECQRVLTLRDGLIVGERKGTGERAAF